MPEPIILAPDAPIETLRAMSGDSDAALLGRFRWAAQAGLTFLGKRDMYKALGYEPTLSVERYRARFRRGGLAHRIVQLWPKVTWRDGFEVNESEKPRDLTTFEQAWRALDKQFKLTKLFRRADLLGQLSNYSVILIGAEGDLDSELPRGKTPLYFSTYLGGDNGYQQNPLGSMLASTLQMTDVVIEAVETDSKNPRFGQPTFYRIRNPLSVDFSRRVHWSRVVHIAEDAFEDELYGTPRLEAVWNLLDDLEKVTGGGAEAFFQRANQGLHINVDKDMTFTDPTAADKALSANVERYIHNIDRVIKTKGVDINTLGSDVANFANQADTIITQIAGTLGIPKRILLGSEMGELASTQDRDNLADEVRGRRQQHAGPNIVRATVDRLIAYGYLPPSETYDVYWPQKSTLTEGEKAEIAVKWASVNATQGETVFPIDEIRDKLYQFDPLTAGASKPVTTRLPGQPGLKAAGAQLTKTEELAVIRALETAILTGDLDTIKRVTGC